MRLGVTPMNPGKSRDAQLASEAPRGSNQNGVRVYNERLVLSLIRRHKHLPKADIARMTGLSPQTISIIINALEADGLLVKLDPVRGKVGQPLVPFALNPEGAFSLGIKVGRRSSDVVLIDFLGRVLGRIHAPHPYPTPQSVVALAQRGMAELLAGLTPAEKARVAGIGIAAPFELWNWEPQFAAPPDVLEAWRHADIRRDVAAVSPWPVYFHNDGTAACAAELVLADPPHSEDFLYMFVGSFLGGGVVIDGQLFPGRTGNGGAIGSMPVAMPGGRFQQALRSASIYVLAEALREEGRDPAVLWQDPDDWGQLGPALDTWIDNSARALALVSVSATAIIDFPSIVIDGAFPATVRRRLVEAVRENLADFDLQGLTPFAIVEGRIGSGAREIGGACLSLLANFSRDREVLFKD